jgi:thiosulfate/3-mercaptopyruvate sulfurtransferase
MSPANNALITAEELNTLLNNSNILLVDLSSHENYLKGHIPGAVHLSPSALSSGEKPAPGKLPSKAKLQQTLQNLGLKEDSHVVCYDDAGFSWAGRFIWTLDILGIKNISIINGGLAAWLAAGFRAESNENIAKPSNFTISLWQENLIAEKDEIIQSIEQGNIQIWDARSQAEFSGEKVLAERGGHIPGAKHLEWTALHDDKGYIADKETLEKTVAATFNQELPIITHCQTHRRSGLTYFVAKKLLGYNIKAYPGSWSEWGNDPTLAIEK